MSRNLSLNRPCAFCQKPVGRKSYQYCDYVCQGAAALKRAGAAPVTRPCPVCGKEFIPRLIKRPAKFSKTCSSHCAHLMVGRASRPRRTARRKLVPCPRCGKDFWPWEPRGKAKAGHVAHARKFCSRACIAKPRRPRPTVPALRLVCPWCRKEFATKHHRQIYCSRQCQDARKGRKRKALKRSVLGDSLTLGELCVRDNWRCGICRRRVHKRLCYPHPMSASIDHIVPLSKGGRDDAINQQLAHLNCNLSKRSRACGSQMRLVG
jgi:hypothetical protein